MKTTHSPRHKFTAALALAGAFGGTLLGPTLTGAQFGRAEAQIAAPNPGSRDQRPFVEAPSLTVVGNGMVSVTPDRATVQLGAEAQGKDAQAAQSAVNTIMQAAIARIRALNIEERRIQTTGVQLYPVYENQRPGDDRTPRVSAYRASNSIKVEVDDLTLVGRVIDAGVAAGANRQEGVFFSLRDDANAREQALGQASANARRKAESLARALGVRLLELVEVSEGASYGPPRPIPGPYMMRGAAAEMAMSTPVQAGELDVNASVTLRYRIAPQG